MSKQSEWCEHMIYDQDLKRWCYSPRIGHSYQQDNWNFCPICSAPRPKKKELWEKFQDYFRDQSRDEATGNCYRLWQALEQIAKEHFKDESQKS